jgi:hypothetical protein
MKMICISLIGILTLLSACTPVVDKTESFIPGTYIRTVEDEFGTAWDTLIIAIQNKEAKEYRIEERWLIKRVLDGKAQEPEYKTMQTTAIYLPERQLLQETQTMLALTFNLENNTMNRGTNLFTKIK